FRAFEEMQHKFQLEMGVITNHTKARKGTPLTNPTRATNIARHGRNAAKLHVTSQAQAHDLVNFSKHARNLGTGLVVIDFADRIGKIHNSYRAGGNWEREMFIESLSFTGSTVTGSLVASWGVSALTFTLVATPIGWVGLIIGGAIVVGASASASIYANSELKDNSGNWYDAIQNSIKSL
ncbi:MAG: hypothetical protein OEM38_10680, partial [Gammaproteobacteria bacterium]|nr:hypothetical protein [Gammaproteobacteria bacterium]